MSPRWVGVVQARVASGWSGVGQRDDHATAVRLATLGMDVAAVQVDDPPGDGEAEPGAAVGGRAGRVGAVEALEDAGLVASAMPGPSSITSMVTPASWRRARTSTEPPCGRVPHRVLEQVGDDLVHPLGVAVGGEVGGVDRHRRSRSSGACSCCSRTACSSSGSTANAVRSSGTAPDSRRERSRSCLTSRPSRSTWASIVRNVSGSGSVTPSTRFSSTACSAVIGVRSSWLTLATRSRRTRSVSASSAAIWLNARASSPTSSRDVVGDPTAVVALGHRRRGLGHLAQRRGHAAREEPHDAPARPTAAMIPLTDGHTPILISDPEDEDRHRHRGDDHEAELELDRRDVVERVGESFATGHGRAGAGRRVRRVGRPSARRTRRRGRCARRRCRACGAARARASRRCARRTPSS